MGKFLCFVGLHCWRLILSDGYERTYACFRKDCEALHYEPGPLRR